MKSFLKSFVHAIRGIWFGVAGQRNLKVQIAIAVIVLVAGFYVQITPGEWSMVLLCIGLVLGLEMINSALEGLVDLVTPERKPLAGKIKDIAAGAVLIASSISVVIGILIFRKYVME